MREVTCLPLKYFKYVSQVDGQAHDESHDHRAREWDLPMVNQHMHHLALEGELRGTARWLDFLGRRERRRDHRQDKVKEDSKEDGVRDAAELTFHV